MATLYGRWAEPHLQGGALLEAEAVLQQTGDVGQVHAQEGAGGGVLGHVAADWRGGRDVRQVTPFR